MLTSILVNLAGILLFLFIFWRKLREDYTSNIIFTSSFYILALLGIGILISRFFFRSFWFWMGLVGVSLGFALGIFRFQMKIYEVLEAVVSALFPWLALFFLNDSIKNTSLLSFLAFVSALTFFTFYYFLDSHYKTFTWYKYGKIGFSGLATLALFFLTRSLVAYFFPYVVSFSGNYEVIISGILAFAFFLLTFNLAQRQI